MRPMGAAPDPALFPYADHVLDRLEAEREPSERLKEAARLGEALVLDFHRHAPLPDDPGGAPPPWCAAIRLERDGSDLVHLRGLVRDRPGCAPMARVLAGLMTARYRLGTPPRVVLDGVELYL